MTYGTMEKIETVTVGSGGQASVTFSSLPTTYDDLQIVMSVRTNRTAGILDAIQVEFNGSSANLSFRELSGDGANTSSQNSATLGRVGLCTGADATASTFGSINLYIPNYRTSTNKSWSSESVTENNATNAWQDLIAGLWSNTAAITSIRLFPLVGTLFNQHSTFTLYGITRVPAGAKATGGVIYDDSSYWYHVFTSSGTFTPSQNITCDYLVVAGGAGGGATFNGDGGGGGGAGGLRCTVGATGGGGALESALSLLASTNYTVTIGAGGAGQPAGWTQTFGNDGSNSVFSTITSTGGGGGSGQAGNGRTGGSGGGAGGRAGADRTGGTGTANQGFGGGNTTGVPNTGGGGGGGSGSAGSATTTTSGANGGSGVATAISGTSTTYAGGGAGGAQTSGAGGGTGGSGGGGNGGNSGANGAAASVNSGSGGGGSGGAASATPTGGNGGSGIVIVRYAK